jgi:hypothetical protein
LRALESSLIFVAVYSAEKEVDPQLFLVETFNTTLFSLENQAF